MRLRARALPVHGPRVVANSTLLVRMVPPAVLAVPAFAMVVAFGITNDLLC